MCEVPRLARTSREHRRFAIALGLFPSGSFPILRALCVSVVRLLESIPKRIRAIERRGPRRFLAGVQTGVIRALGIRVSTVRSSPYCRPVATARLAFGSATLDPALTHTVTADEATAKRQALALRRLLATLPEPGSNGVLAGHTGNLQEATGIWPSPEGVPIVFKPDGQGRFDYVATVPPAHWAALLRAATPAPATR